MLQSARWLRVVSQNVSCSVSLLYVPSTLSSASHTRRGGKGWGQPRYGRFHATKPSGVPAVWIVVFMHGNAGQGCLIGTAAVVFLFRMRPRLDAQAWLLRPVCEHGQSSSTRTVQAWPDFLAFYLGGRQPQPTGHSGHSPLPAFHCVVLYLCVFTVRGGTRISLPDPGSDWPMALWSPRIMSPERI